MNSAQLLAELAIEGQDPDYHDGLNGYFSWDIENSGQGPVLTVRFAGYGEDGELDEISESSWMLK